MNTDLLKIISEPNTFSFFKNLPKEWVDDKYLKQIYQKMMEPNTILKPLKDGKFNYQHSYEPTKYLNCEINNIKYSIKVRHGYAAITSDPFCVFLDVESPYDCSLRDENNHEILIFPEKDLLPTLEMCQKYSFEEFINLINFS